MSKLSVHDLTFRYRRAGEELFGGLSHTFSPGAISAVTGPSGRGKSTLLYVLGLMLTPAAGTVRIDDEPVSNQSDANRSRLRARNIGFVFQDSELDPTRKVLDSVMEPALLGGRSPGWARVRAQQLMEQLGVSGRGNHKPGQVSGGQAQRIAVCRALMNDPGVILADEPTGNLDRENAAQVLDSLASTAPNTTVVIATHDPFVLEHADEVLEL